MLKVYARGGHNKKSHKVYAKELAGIHPHIRPIEKYKGTMTRIKHRVKCGHVWKAPPNMILLSKGNCPRCRNWKTGGHNVKSHRQYLNDIKKKHGKDIRILGKYITSGKHIKAKHKCGHIWRPIARDLIAHGCPRCSNGLKTTKHFLKDLRKIWKNKYSLLEKYKGSMEFMHVKHNKCGHVWNTIPARLLQKHGCPRCSSRYIKHSKMSIEWLEYEAKKRRIKIEHAANGNEFVIQDTRLRADGYNKRTNTIFEFYGDAFHGNLKKYGKRKRVHPMSNATAGKLNKLTKKRERKIKKLGFNLITMWESDWNKIKECL